MSDPVKRAERWKAKYNVERVKDTLNDIREDMGKRYEAAIVIVHDGREVLVQVWPYVQAYRIVVSAKMFLFRASVPSTSLRAGSEAAGVIVPRTKDEVQRTKQAPRAKDKMAGATGLLLLSLPPCPSSQDVLTLGFWSSVAEARSHKPQAAGRELGLRA